MILFFSLSFDLTRFLWRDVDQGKKRIGVLAGVVVMMLGGGDDAGSEGGKEKDENAGLAVWLGRDSVESKAACSEYAAKKADFEGGGRERSER